jgi:hypothetical protein
VDEDYAGGMLGHAFLKVGDLGFDLQNLLPPLSAGSTALIGCLDAQFFQQNENATLYFIDDHRGAIASEAFVHFE